MMKIQKGIVKYKDRSDIVCTYGTLEDGTNYYFLDFGSDYKLPNGNIIASKELVEAIDPMYAASHIGVIDENGNEVIPFRNRMIRHVAGEVLLVEIAEPVSDGVKDAIEKRESSMATSLVSTSALIKDRLNEKMAGNGKFLFNDLFSEATLYDLNGNNLLGDKYYSFITQVGDKYFLSKNVADAPIDEYPAATTQEVTETPLDVSEVVVPTNLVEDALEGVSEAPTTVENKEDELEEEPIPQTTNEDVVVPAVEEVVKEPVEQVQEEVQTEETTPVEVPVAPVEEAPVETPVEEPVKEETVVEEKEEEPEEEVSLNIGPVEDEDEVKLNFEEEDNDNEVIIDEDEEKTTLDDLIQFTDEDEYEEEDDDPLKDYMVETDYIEFPEEFNDSTGVDTHDSSSTIVEDVAKYMKNLMTQNRNLVEQNKKLIAQNSKLKESLDKMVASRNSFISKLNSQEKKIDALNNKIKTLENNISTLEQKNHEQGRIIDSQSQDRAKLEKVLEEVQHALGEN